MPSLALKFIKCLFYPLTPKTYEIARVQGQGKCSYVIF